MCHSLEVLFLICVFPKSIPAIPEHRAQTTGKPVALLGDKGPLGAKKGMYDLARADKTTRPRPTKQGTTYAPSPPPPQMD